MKFRITPFIAVASVAAAGCSAGAVQPESSGVSEQAYTFNVISGTLTNTSGGPIANARVTIQGTGVATATTNASGQYVFSGLAITSHTITVSLANCTFSPAVANNIWPNAVVNFTGSGSGCGSATTGSGSGAAPVTATVAPCPNPDGSDAQERAAATVAFSLMQGAAQMGGPTAPVFSNTILAAQRYRVQAGGAAIEFDPNDPLYRYVSNNMKAALAAAQLDSTVAAYLVGGLNYAYNNSNGWYFPSIDSVQVLANFHYPNEVSAHIADNTSGNNSHSATASGDPWCGTQMVTILDTVQQSYSFSPLYSLEITNPGVSIGGGWLTAPPAAFHGYSQKPQTPFNGPSGNGNPYLVVSVNGVTTNWASYNFNPANCWNNPAPYQCTGTIQIDPVPYAEPGAYYDTTGNMVGTQANPFQLLPTVLYAVSDHQGNWATRTVSGVQEWGTFSTPVSVLGVTIYKYVKVM